MVVSGPSGSGKDTLVFELRKIEPKLAYSVSVTTRAPRAGEIEGVHYHFIQRPEFERLAAQGEFLESREYAGNLYGTPKHFVEECMRSGRDLIMKPEVSGALAIKRRFPSAVLVFLTVPSNEVLERRLAERGTDSQSDRAARLAIAQREAAQVRQYDYLIINDTVEAALGALRSVLAAERLKTARLVQGEPAPTP